MNDTFVCMFVPERHGSFWYLRRTANVGISDARQMLVFQTHGQCWYLRRTANVGISDARPMLVFETHGKCWYLRRTDVLALRRTAVRLYEQNNN